MHCAANLLCAARFFDLLDLNCPIAQTRSRKLRTADEVANRPGMACQKRRGGETCTAKRGLSGAGRDGGLQGV